MNATMPSKPDEIVQVGPDQVVISEQEVVIQARRPMPNWDVREINHEPVYFQDRRYYLVEKRKAAGPYGVRYVLLPWPSDLTTNARGFHVYDADAVAERDGNARSGQLHDVGRSGLLLFYPFLGLLWSRTQHRLTRFGFVPHAITGASIFTVFSLLFAQGVFAVVLINTSLRSGKIMVGGLVRALAPGDQLHLGPVSVPIMLLDVALTAAFLGDLLIRYSRYLHEDQWAGGFLEWVLRPAGRPE